jgi:hypothetical protein
MLYERGWDDTLATISPDVRAEMERAGKELNESDRVLAVQDWMNAQPESSVEVTALDGLLQLLDNFVEKCHPGSKRILSQKTRQMRGGV